MYSLKCIGRIFFRLRVMLGLWCGLGFTMPEIYGQSCDFEVISEVYVIDLDQTNSQTITPNDLVTQMSGDCINLVFVDKDAKEYSSLTFDCSNLGDNSVSIVAIDKADNRSLPKIVTIEVHDHTPPTFELKADTYDAELDNNGSCTVLVEQLVKNLVKNQSDNCTDVDKIRFFVNGSDKLTYSCRDIGKKNVTIIAVDESNNSSEPQTITLNIQDIMPPFVGVMRPAGVGDVDLVTDDGEPYCTYTFSPPDAKDNCGIKTIEYSIKDANGDASDYKEQTEEVTHQFGVGESYIYYRITDVNKNVNSSYSIRLLGTDNQPPTIDCLVDVVLTAQNGVCYNDYAFPLPATDDNCGVAKVEYSIKNPDGTVTNWEEQTGEVTYRFKVGTSTITYKVTDINDNENNTCSYQVTVEDTQPPTINCPVNVEDLVTDPGVCYRMHTFPKPSTNDNCGVAKVKYSITDPQGNVSPYIEQTDNVKHQFEVGTSIITHVVIDIHGLSDTCSYNITVTDNVSPTITCPADVTGLIAETGVCYKTYTFLVPATHDNCSVAKIEYYVKNPDGTTTDWEEQTAPVAYQFKTGASTVSYRVTDVNGGTNTSCSFQVMVSDDQKPGIAPFADMIVPAGPDSCSTKLGFDPVPTDNCVVKTVKYDVVSDNGDTGGKTGSATLKITGYEFPVGESTVTFTVTDIHDNESVASFKVTVVDLQKPGIAPFADITVPAGLDSCSTKLSFDPAPTDNCGVASVGYTIVSNNGVPVNMNGNAGLKITGYEFPVGESIVTFTVIDIHGNDSIAKFKVTVKDLQKPKIAPFVDITVPAGIDSCSTKLSFDPMPTDNCAVASVKYDIVSDNSTSASNSGTASLKIINYEFPVGTSTVTFTVTDIHGNDSTVNFKVKVEDKQAPTIITPVGSIDTTLLCDEHQKIKAVLDHLLPEAYDNCSTTGYPVLVSVSRDSIAGGCPSTYTIIREWQFEDQYGNKSETFTQVISVVDTVPPIVNCVQNATIYLDENGQATLKAKTLDNRSVDNCSTELTYHVRRKNTGDAPQTEIQFNCNDIDVITPIVPVVFFVTDGCGNTDSCFVDIVVKDTIAPIVSCKNITVNLRETDGKIEITADMVDNGSRDNCTTTLGLQIDQSDFDCSHLGENRIKLIVTDQSGNKDSCIAVVTIRYYDGRLPRPTVSQVPTNGELCSGDITGINLTNPGFDTQDITEWKWEVNPVGGISGTGNGGPAQNTPVIQQTLTNSTDEYKEVVYSISSILYGKCILDTIKTSVFVNPVPKLLAMADTSICNNTLTKISAQTYSIVTPNAEVFYTWEAKGNSVTGYTASIGDGVIAGSQQRQTESYIEDNLNNTTRSAQKVTYALSPSLRLNLDNRYCSTLDTQKIAITIEPTPIIKVLASMDTICNKSTIEFKVDSLNNPDGKWLYTLNRTIPANDSIARGPIPYTQNSRFTQTIYNNNNGSSTIRYAFSPRIVITSLKQEYTCRARQNDTLINIAVNPTPVLTVAAMTNIAQHTDSICYKDGTALRINSINGSVIGDMRYNLCCAVYNAGKVINVATTPDSAMFAGNVNNWNSIFPQAGLENVSDDVQKVTYSFFPVIKYDNSLYCKGVPVDQDIFIAPELKYDLVSDTAKVLIGGYDIRCSGDKGALTVENARGGWQSAKGYDYVWTAPNTSITDANAKNLNAGTYSVNVIDKIQGCHTRKTITLTQPDVLKLDDSRTFKESPSCNGPTGTIILAVDGGVRNYKYAWTGPAQYTNADSSAFDLRAGDYNITVTDINRCVSENLIQLSYFSGDTLFTPTWNKLSYGTGANGIAYHVSCNGFTDGRMNPSTDKTVTSYTLTHGGNVIKSKTAQPGDVLNWDFDSSSDFWMDNLAPGTYNLSIIDNEGCKFTLNHDSNLEQPVILEPPAVSFTATVPKYENNYEVKCDSSQTGRIFITDVKGGYGEKYAPFEYDWTGIGVTSGANQEHLAAGTYTLTVKSKHDYVETGVVKTGWCTADQSFTLNAPPPLGIAATFSDYNGYQVDCYDHHTGKINISVSGGDGAYTYRWSTDNGSGLVPQAQNQTNLTAGTYKLDVIYSSGLCVKTREYTLNQPQQIKGNATISPIQCYGDKNASITLNPTGGVTHITGIPTYKYVWYSTDAAVNQSTNQNQSNLGPGSYMVSITDQNACIKTERYDLEQPAQILANIKAEDMSCDPGNDGYISVAPAGGTPNYTYLWSNGATTATITGLSKGVYSVKITDAHNCNTTAKDSISIPGALTVKATATTNFNGYNIDCFGNNTGKISLDVQNGRTPYTYRWSSGNATANIDHAKAGFYQVFVVDNFNCKGTDTITLSQPTKLMVQPVTTDVSCPGGSNGSIFILSTGGLKPYEYNWSIAGVDSTVAKDLKAGNYHVRVTDINNCFVDMDIALTQPAPFQVYFDVKEPFCPEITDGEIRTTVTGGTPSYTYLWKELKATSPNISDVGSGTYTLVVTDAENCESETTVEVGYTSTSCLKIPNAFSPNDDGVNDRWEILAGDPNEPARYHLRDLYPEAIVEVYSANWGILLFRSQKGYPEPWDGKYRGKYLPVNSYWYIIRLNNNTKPITGNVTIIR